MATKHILKKKKRPAAYPTSGFVGFNYVNSSLGNVVHGFKEDTMYLSRYDIEKLDAAQLMVNRRGFMMAVVCPRDGSVVLTHRGNDLPDGMYAKCSMPDCPKVWLDASS